MQKIKKYFIMLVVFVVLLGSAFLYFKYYFNYTARNKLQRQIDNIRGQNLTVTVFGVDGKIIKRWYGIKKITSVSESRGYVYFYSSDNKYVQLPNSIWYIAEEE